MPVDDLQYMDAGELCSLCSEHTRRFLHDEPYDDRYCWEVFRRAAASLRANNNLSTCLSADVGLPASAVGEAGRQEDRCSGAGKAARHDNQMGNDAIWPFLYNQYSPFVRRWIRNQSGWPSLYRRGYSEDDLVQDVWLRLVSSDAFADFENSFPSVAKVLSFLHTIVWRRVRDLTEKRYWPTLSNPTNDEMPLPANNDLAELSRDRLTEERLVELAQETGVITDHAEKIVFVHSILGNAMPEQIVQMWPHVVEETVQIDRARTRIRRRAHKNPRFLHLAIVEICLTDERRWRAFEGLVIRGLSAAELAEEYSWLFEDGRDAQSALAEVLAELRHHPGLLRALCGR